MVVASKRQIDAMEDLMPTEHDLLYEEELLRNPYSLKMWWRYIQARSDASARRRYLLFERALKALPGSYKVRMHGLRCSRPRAAVGCSPRCQQHCQPPATLAVVLLHCVAPVYASSSSGHQCPPPWWFCGHAAVEGIPG